MELQTVKDYLKIDYDEDDLLLKGFIASAKEYMLNAGVPENNQSELYKTVILMLVALFYENRDSDKDIKIPTIITHFITQLSCVRGVIR